MAKVLVVDDDADIRKLICKYVEQEGHEALSASNTSEAMIALDKKPDLMFLDIDMPGETGVALVIRLRAKNAHMDTAIVFVTAFLERCATFRDSQLESVEVITKPFRREDIINTIRHHCIPVNENGCENEILF